MECGACERNCPTGAIEVESGVGCATALFYAALTGRDACCGPRDEPCCGSEAGADREASREPCCGVDGETEGPAAREACCAGEGDARDQAADEPCCRSGPARREDE